MTRTRITCAAISLCFLVTLCLATSAKADTTNTYTYTGSDFTFAIPPYTTSDHVTATLILSAPLPNSLSPTDEVNEAALVLSFTMSDGVQTFTNADQGWFSFSVGTSSIGQIISWTLNFLDADIVDEIHSQNPIPSSSVDEGAHSESGAYTAVPGVWSGPTPTPTSEPGVLNLLLPGLCVLGLLVGSTRPR